MSSTFNRDDLANYGKQADEEIEETPADESGDETADDESTDESADETQLAARLDALRQGAPRAEREPEETLRLPPIDDPLATAPMPKLSDDDVAFDEDKYSEKMTKWVKVQGRVEARREMQEEVGARRAYKFNQNLESKIAAFEKDHPDFATKVRTNPVLASHQLHPFAGRAVAKSEYTADLLYKFGSDTAHAIRVANMAPEDQVIAIHDMIDQIKAQKAKSAPRGGERPAQRTTVTRKGPATREQELSGKLSMDDIARESRERKMKSRFYGK